MHVDLLLVLQGLEQTIPIGKHAHYEAIEYAGIACFNLGRSSTSINATQVSKIPRENLTCLLVTFGSSMGYICIFLIY